MSKERAVRRGGAAPKTANGDGIFTRLGKERYIVRQEKIGMEAPQTATPATPETVWAILRELAAEQRELAASQKETDRAIKETELARKERERDRKEFVTLNCCAFIRSLSYFLCKCQVSLERHPFLSKLNGELV